MVRACGCGERTNLSTATVASRLWLFLLLRFSLCHLYVCGTGRHGMRSLSQPDRRRLGGFGLVHVLGCRAQERRRESNSTTHLRIATQPICV